MAAPMVAGLPVGLDFGTAYVLQFTALDAATGAVVAGVNVSRATLTVQNVGGGNLGQLLEPTEIEWLNLPIEDTT